MSKTEGEKLAAAGAKAAMDHADRKEPSWGNTALAILKTASAARDEFTTDQLRECGRALGLAEPPDARAWGGVIRRAVALGLIEHVRWERAANKSHHSGPVSVWRKKP